MLCHHISLGNCYKRNVFARSNECNEAWMETVASGRYVFQQDDEPIHMSYLIQN